MCSKENSANKLKENNLRVSLLFIFLFIGLFSANFFLNSYLNHAIETDESWRNNLGKSLKFQELSKFKEDLKPKSLLPEIFSKLEQRLIYSTQKNNYFWDLYSDKDKPKFTGKKFLKFLKHELCKKGIKPSMVFAYDEDSETSVSLLNDAPLEKVQLPYFFECIKRQCLAYAKIPFYEVTSESENPSAAISRMLTTFNTTKVFYAKELNTIFTDHNSFQKLFLYFSPILKNDKFYGFYGGVIYESDINPQILLKNALNRVVPNGITRHYFFKKNKHGKSKEYLSAAIPNSFISINLTRKRAARPQNISIHSYSKLAVALDHNFFVSPYKEMAKNVNFAFGISALVLIMIWFKSFLHGLIFPINIRNKFTFLIALIVIFPNIFIYYFAKFSSDNLSHLKTAAAKNILDNKLDFIEELMAEGDIRQVLQTLELKSKLTKEFKGFENKEKIDFSPKLQATFKNLTNKIILMDLNGKLFSPSYDTESRRSSILQLCNMAKILQHLGMLNLNSELAKSHLKTASLTDGFLGEYWNSLNQAKILAAEGENTLQLTALNYVLRMIYFLVPNLESKSFSPIGVCFTTFRNCYYFSQLFTKLDGYPHKTFNYSENGLNFEFSVANRDGISVLEESVFSKGSSSTKLKNLLNTATILKSKDFIVRRFGNETFIGGWRFLRTKTLLIAGSCNFVNEDDNYFKLEILPWIILSFSILVLLLLSKILATIFISPLDALFKGATLVDQKERFETRIYSSSYDEFDELTKAFNQMNKGLHEKKQISRFLSNQLLSHSNDAASNTLATTKEKKMAILFSDIRNFTTISEKYNAEDVVELLNTYFTSMEKAILANGGTIEKFIGDAIFASFSDGDFETKEKRACMAALEMKKQLHKFNEQRKQNNLFEIANGVGISTGKVFSGSLGITGNLEFILTGKQIDLAAQLESISKNSKHIGIIISNEVAQAIKNDFRLEALSDVSIENCHELVGVS